MITNRPALSMFLLQAMTAASVAGHRATGIFRLQPRSSPLRGASRLKSRPSALLPPRGLLRKRPRRRKVCLPPLYAEFCGGRACRARHRFRRLLPRQIHRCPGGTSCASTPGLCIRSQGRSGRPASVSNTSRTPSAAGNGASILKMMDVSRHKSVILAGYVRNAELSLVYFDSATPWAESNLSNQPASCPLGFGQAQRVAP